MSISLLTRGYVPITFVTGSITLPTPPAPPAATARKDNPPPPPAATVKQV